MFDVRRPYSDAPGFGGIGLNDMSARTDNYTRDNDTTYTLQIDLAAGTDTFQWSDGIGGPGWDATGVAMTGGWQRLNNDFYVKFDATTGHNLNDLWIVAVYANPLIYANTSNATTGQVGIKTLNPIEDLTVNGTFYSISTPYVGWHGSHIRIKVLPSDFMSDEGDMEIAGGGYIEEDESARVVASVPIPEGYRAYRAMVYGSDATNTVTINEGVITATTETSRGSGNPNTEIIFSANVTSSVLNYLAIVVDWGSGDRVYGGYVLIEKP